MRSESNEVGAEGAMAGCRWSGLVGIAWVVLVIVSVAGCSPTREMPLERLDASDRRLAEGYSLLYELMSKQSGLEGILMIRSVPEPTRQLIADITAASGVAAHRLEQWSEADPTFLIRQTGLPPVEVDTRNHIEQLTTMTLLTGGNFETRLLLTQTEANNYAAALAHVLSRSDVDEQRAQVLEAWAKTFSELHARAVASLQAKESS